MAGGTEPQIVILIRKIIGIDIALVIRIPVRINKARTVPLLVLYYLDKPWKPYSIYQGYFPNIKLQFFLFYLKQNI
jgi:hypothetical protein